MNPFQYWNDVFCCRGYHESVDFFKSTSTDGSILVEGFFENYPKVKCMDPSMTTLSEACDWLSFDDFANGISLRFSSQKGRYISVTAVSFLVLHRLCHILLTLYFLPFAFKLRANERRHYTNFVPLMRICK